MIIAVIFILFFWIVGLAIGIFLIFNPESAIKIEQRFYAKINWRMEPISMSKEIRNTRLMGFILIILLIIILLLLHKNNFLP